jgi:hypothetical protein
LWNATFQIPLLAPTLGETTVVGFSFLHKTQATTFYTTTCSITKIHFTQLLVGLQNTAHNRFELEHVIKIIATNEKP